MLLLGLLSCSSPGEKESKLSTKSNDEFQLFKIDTKAKPVSIFDLIEEVEIMRLEETEQSLLSSICCVYTTEDRLIVPSGSDGNIYSFSKKGEFISKFRHVGNGPGEYEFISGFWTEGDTIFLVDINRRNLISYDLEGNHLRSWKIPFDSNNFYSYGNGFVSDLNYSPYQDTLQFNILFLDEELKVKKMANPYTSPLRLYMGSTLNTFRPYGKDLIFHRNTSDTVFLIDNSEIRSLLKFDFGAEWLWTEETIKNNPRTTPLIRETSLVWWLTSYVGEKWIYLSYRTSLKEIDYVLIDRSSGAQKTFRLNNNSSKYSMRPIKWEEDRLLVSFNSLDVAQLAKELSSESLTFRQSTTLEKIESSENPVLMWVKFKSNQR